MTQQTKFKAGDAVWVGGKVHEVHEVQGQPRYWVMCESGELRNEADATLSHATGLTKGHATEWIKSYEAKIVQLASQNAALLNRIGELESIIERSRAILDEPLNKRKRQKKTKEG